MVRGSDRREVERLLDLASKSESDELVTRALGRLRDLVRLEAVRTMVRADPATIGHRLQSAPEIVRSTAIHALPPALAPTHPRRDGGSGQPVRPLASANAFAIVARAAAFGVPPTLPGVSGSTKATSAGRVLLASTPDQLERALQAAGGREVVRLCRSMDLRSAIRILRIAGLIDDSRAWTGSGGSTADGTECRGEIGRLSRLIASGLSGRSLRDALGRSLVADVLASADADVRSAAASRLGFDPAMGETGTYGRVETLLEALEVHGD